MKILTITFFLTFACGIASSQQVFDVYNDSLKQNLSIEKQDTSRVLTMAILCASYAFANFDSAVAYGNQALALAKKIKFPRGEAWALNCLGNAFINQGDIPKSMELRLKSLQIAEQYGYLTEEAACLDGLGFIYNYLKDYPKALSYGQKARQIIDKAKLDVFGLDLKIRINLNLGTNYMLNNQLDSSFIYLQKTYNETLNLYWHPILLRYFGELQFRLGNHGLALEYLRKSISINKVSNDTYSGTQANNTIATFFDQLKQPDSCIYYAKVGLAYAQKIGYKRGALEASNLLTKQYEQLDDKNQAFYYQKTAATLNDELYGAQKVLALQKTLSEQEQRQREIEIDKITYQNQLKQYAFLAILGVLFLIGFILYRNNRQKQKANLILQEQKEKVETTLSQLRSTQAQLIQSEKLASLGELTAGIAHEIQNPLNFVNNFAEVSAEMLAEMEEELDKGDTQEVKAIAADLKQNLSKINHHGQRAASIVKGMLEHSRASTGVKEPTDLNALADEFLRLAYHGLRAKDNNFNARLETHFDPDFPKVSVIPQDIGRVLLNLINNAFYAVNQRATTVGAPLAGTQPYVPTVIVSTKKLENALEVHVQDNGNGLPESIKDKIFQPFFTTKPTGQGTGLGLSLAYDIVTKGHGGSLEVLSTEGVGSEFILTLPFKTNG
jgi:two-component system, NtrC family, sensor kinase